MTFTTVPGLLIAFGAAPWLLLGLAAIPVVVLYLMKRRYQDRPIASTLLWMRVLEDLTARSSARRPTEWLSLLLLVLAITCLALAAADLRLGGGGGAGRALVLVVDVSASMGAVEADGERRIDRAREGALEAVRGSRSGDPVTAIVAGRTPRVLFHATTDHRRAREELSRLEVEESPGRLVEALAVAAGDALAQEARGLPTRVVVLSDFAEENASVSGVDFQGASLVLVPCGGPIENVGIVHAAVSGGGGGAPGRLLVRVAATERADAAPVTRTLSLLRDGELVAAREVTLEPGRERAVAFEVTADDGGTRYRARLEPEDALAADDEAFVGVAPRPAPRLLVVGPRDPFLDRLAAVFPGLRVTRVRTDGTGAAGEEGGDLAEAARAASRAYDLAIVTALPPPGAAIPARNELWLGVVPPGLSLTEGVPALDPVIVDWDRGDPLLRHVGFEGLLVVEARPVESAPLAASPAEVLVRTTAGPQLVRVRADDRSVLVWASRLPESNLALIPAFPLLVRNLLGESLGGIDGEVHRTAEPLRVAAGLGRLGGTVDLTVEGPDGGTQTARLWSREELTWSEGDTPGFYVARAAATDGGEETSRVLGRSLLSRDETVLAARVPTAEAYDAPGAEVTPAERFSAERPVLRELLLLALVLLAAEAIVTVAGRRRRGRTRGVASPAAAGAET